MSDVPSTAVAHPLEVLVVDDDEIARSVVHAAVIALGHNARATSSGFAALRMHQQERADVIISGLRMAPLDGLELCRRVRAADDGTYTYFLFTSIAARKRDLIDAARAGADDCLDKPVDLDDLEARLIAAARVVGAYRKLSERNINLRHDSEAAFRAARVDALTGVGNRLRMDEELEALQESVARYGRHVSFAMCDVDQFKRYNDHFGHPAGDDALRRIGQAIVQNVRRVDRVYRYGGEEFLVLLPEQRIGDAAAAMERLRGAIEALALSHAPNARRPVVTVSVGLAPVAVDGDRSVHAAIDRADRALYVAKARGGNVVATYDDQPTAHRASA